jgi:Holliday junction DNA helicase RuvA
VLIALNHERSLVDVERGFRRESYERHPVRSLGTVEPLKLAFETILLDLADSPCNLSRCLFACGRASEKLFNHRPDACEGEIGDALRERLCDEREKVVGERMSIFTECAKEVFLCHGYPFENCFAYYTPKRMPGKKGKEVYNGSHMIRRLKGTVLEAQDKGIVIEIGGVGLLVAMPPRILKHIKTGEVVDLHTYLHVKEDALDLYGFPDIQTLKLFESLISINGVGPRSALAVLEVADVGQIEAAIAEGRADLLSRAPGVGRKTAERIVLELRGRIAATESAGVVKSMDTDTDLVETLVNLGYRKEQAAQAVAKIPKEVTGLEARLKHVLKLLQNT